MARAQSTPSQGYNAHDRGDRQSVRRSGTMKQAKAGQSCWTCKRESSEFLSSPQNARGSNVFHFFVLITERTPSGGGLAI